jgi:hypothetical protein
MFVTKCFTIMYLVNDCRCCCFRSCRRGRQTGENLTTYRQKTKLKRQLPFQLLIIIINICDVIGTSTKNHGVPRTMQWRVYQILKMVAPRPDI